MTDEKIRLDELLEELYYLREENQQLKVDNDFLQRQNTALKTRCSKQSLELQDITSELTDLKFTNKNLLPTDDLFLQAEIAAEKHEAETVGAMGSFLGDDY